MNDILVSAGIDPVIIAVVIGPLLTALQAAVDVPSWTAHQRRLVAVVAALVAGVVIWWAGGHPAQWEALVASCATVLGVAQASFALLKRLGVIDWIGSVTPGGEERAQ